ncbi:MAG: G-D-S-L family lipolytic protein [Kordia sp.]|nr:MAG: G-D-S-L family lipolytic protein [Kordia sp.]
MKNIKYIAIIALGLVACEPELDNSVEDASFYSAGTADFSTFVSVGNSLTAGYADDALYLDGQKHSYPNILADRFSHVDGGAFTQPLVSDNIGGLMLGGSPIADTRLVLSGDPLVLTNLVPPTDNLAQPSTTDPTNVLVGPFNNVSAPGAKSFHLLSDVYGEASGILDGTANPYFVRMASSPSATMLGDAVAQNPTFFSLWIGNNDILSFATSGGVGVDQLGNLNPTTYGGNDITDPTLFHGTYDALLNGLTANGAKGVVMNLPSVTSIPYFTTVPYAPLDPTNPDFGPQIPTLNGIFSQLNGVYAYLGVPERSIVFSETSASAVVIIDENLVDLSAQITAVFLGSPAFVPFVESLGLPAAAAPLVANLLGTTYGQSRQANANDLLVLPSSSIIGTINQDVADGLEAQGLPAAMATQFASEGITLPLEDKWVLTANELTMITNAQTAYNNSISMLAAAKENVILVDVKAAMEQLSIGGLSSNGVTITGEYATGGGFSLDGVHPTARGYAFISNIILKRINEEFNATIPETNTGNYPTVYID